MEVNKQVLIPVAGLSKALSSSSSLPGIAFSNSFGDNDIYRPYCALCTVRERSLRWDSPSSTGVLPIVVCLSMIFKHRQ
jgi:hypothetical protein